VVPQRLRVELWAFKRAVNPMATGGVNGWYRKLITLILVGVWSVLALGLAEQPSQLVMVSLTAFVFLLVGRLWGVEADRIISTLNPITIDFGREEDDK